MTRFGRSRWTIPALMIGAMALNARGAEAQPAKASAAAPAKPGTVTGTLTVGGTPVTLTHAYAAGPIDGDKYVVELTDQALPEAALATELKFGGGQGLLRSGKAQGLFLYVDAKGFVVTAIPFAGEVRGNKMLSSVGSLPSFKVAAGQVTGTGKMTTDDTNQGWSYQAQFTAPVRPVK